MRCDDFVCLGRTVPEESRKYGVRVCCAGYSEELKSLMRVYPLPVRNIMRSRNEYRVDLRRNEQDSRSESWRLLEGGCLEATGACAGVADITRTLRDMAVPSIRYLNQERMSLGVLLLDEIQGEFRQRSSMRCATSDQRLLFDELERDVAAAFIGAEQVDLMPYLTFADADGMHTLQIREWGCYEWLRNSRSKASQLWDNLRLERPQLVVVGNMANHRNVWLVIKTFPMSRERQLMLA